MIKVTVLYGHPTDSDVFEKYYSKTHSLLVAATKEIIRTEFTKFLANPDGSAPAYYRMAELYFENPAEMQKGFDSAEGKAMAADVPNFATGGALVIFGTTE